MTGKATTKVIDHVIEQGYFVTNEEPTNEERGQYSKIIKIVTNENGINAQRTSMDLPIKKVIAAVQATTNDQVVLQPTMEEASFIFI
jgi:hypothetical protein